ncbi:MAG: hypothetical protein AAF441_27820, partial [Pseudomonadota bacterium]
MSKVRALIEMLVDAGCDAVTAGVAVAEAMAAGASEAVKPADTRSISAKRQARYRERQKERHEPSPDVTDRNESVTDRNVDADAPSLPPCPP